MQANSLAAPSASMSLRAQILGADAAAIKRRVSRAAAASAQMRTRDAAAAAPCQRVDLRSQRPRTAASRSARDDDAALLFQHSTRGGVRHSSDDATRLGAIPPWSGPTAVSNFATRQQLQSDEPVKRSLDVYAVVTVSRGRCCCCCFGLPPSAVRCRAVVSC
jgi:hypothetical protein